MPFLLGIDVGTSACKVALFTPDGAVAAQANGQYEVLYPQQGWAEQNPDSWWKAICSSIKAMLEKSGINPSEIAGVGVDGQSWSAIALSSDGKCLCNTPIWMDTRAADICARLEKTIGGDKIFEVCGNPLQPAYTLPKILWYKENLPHVYNNADKILQSNSYIVYKLTGSVSQDISQSYGLQCFDMRKAKYDDALCAEMGLNRDLLPEVAACHEIVGHITKQAAIECGLCVGTPVVAGGLDAACGALGAGVVSGGDTQEQGGQAGGMSICLDDYCSDPRLILGYHVVPHKLLLQGGSVGGGGIIKWFDEQLGAAEHQAALKNATNSFAELDKLAATISAGADGLVFLPYMAGERSPIWDAKAKGVYYGLDYAKTRAHMVRASLEGVAYSLRHNIEIAEQAGAKVTRLRSMGGAANSRLWTQIKSDVTGKPIDVPSSDTATTLGAAILAGVAVGVFENFDDAVQKTIQVTRTHEPSADTKPAYNNAYQTYRELYESLKSLMQRG